jgi:hypothetical protein
MINQIFFLMFLMKSVMPREKGVNLELQKKTEQD